MTTQRATREKTDRNLSPLPPLHDRVWAFEPFVIRDIRVDGLQRIAAGTVFTYLPAKVGDRIDNAAAATPSAPCSRPVSSRT